MNFYKIREFNIFNAQLLDSLHKKDKSNNTLNGCTFR